MELPYQRVADNIQAYYYLKSHSHIHSQLPLTELSSAKSNEFLSANSADAMGMSKPKVMPVALSPTSIEICKKKELSYFLELISVSGCNSKHIRTIYAHL